MNYKRKSRRRFFLLKWSRTLPISSWIPLWNSNGADSHSCHYAYVTPCLGEKKKYHCGGDSWRGGLFTKRLKKWMKAVFLLGCYGCIFHGTWNSAQLCQNLGISGRGGFEHPNPPRYATDTTCCKSQRCAPEDGQMIAPKYVELILEINKLLLLHLFGLLYYLPTMMMYGQTQTKFHTLH